MEEVVDELEKVKRRIRKAEVDLEGAQVAQDRELELKYSGILELLLRGKKRLIAERGAAASSRTTFALPPSPTGTQFYLAEMTMIGSKNVKGVRAEVYTVAAKVGGFYFHSKEQSIFYVGADLNVNIMFETNSDCARFVNELDNRLRYFPLLREVHIKDTFDRIAVDFNPRSVLQRHYVFSKEDSEAYSVAFTRDTHITAKTTIDFRTELTMIEASTHEDFYGLKCYKCHLMNQSDHPEERDNPNNVLWMSWLTHQRFDGLHNTIGEYRVPQFAISYISRSHQRENNFQFEERERVEIAIECIDDRMLGIMRRRVKAGMRVDAVAKSIYTYVCVEDAEDFQRCLTYKYRETHFMWTQYARGTELKEEEAHQLRRRARVHCK